MANNNKHTGPNVPALRFPEFSGEWEYKSLGEIGESLIGLTYSPSDVVKEGGTIVFRSSNIQEGVIDYGDLVRVSKKIKDSIITRDGDLLICARNGSTRLIGKNALLKKSDEGQTFGAFMMVFRSIDNRFVHQLLSTKAYSTQVSENLGARINQITTRNFAEYTFGMPQTSEEKEKIGTFLELINDRIETQSKIIEELTALRSALIEKCAKQSGNFFSLSDILREVEERSTTANQYQVLSSTVKGIFSQKEYFNKDIASEDNKGYKVVRKGHIVLSPQNLWMGNINYNDRFDIGIVSPSYKVFSIKEGFNPIFIAALLQTKKALNEYMLASEQGASIVRRNLNIEAFMAIKFRIPDARQQDSLSMAITAINAKLNNERCYLEQLTMQKSCLLENMFI